MDTEQKRNDGSIPSPGVNKFFGRPHGLNGYLSQWYLSAMTGIRDITYHCAEQCMMYHKARVVNGRGENLLGKALMEARSKLR